MPPPGFDPWFWNPHPGFPKSAAGAYSSAQVVDSARCPSHSEVQPLAKKQSRNPQLWLVVDWSPPAQSFSPLVASADRGTRSALHAFRAQQLSPLFVSKEVLCA